MMQHLSVQDTVPSARSAQNGVPTVALITRGATHSLDPTVMAAFEARELKFVEVLKRQGVAVERVAWNDAAVRWAKYDLGVIRSVYDYYDHFSDFLTWLTDIQTLKQPVFANPPAMVRWNTDKHYLQDLADEGIPVIPSVYLKQGDTADIAQIAHEQGWNKAVIIKPVVSGGAMDTYRVNLDNAPTHASQAVLGLEAGNQTLNRLLQHKTMIVQQFLPNVQDGERSFIFFDGQLSHGILKKPKAGEFRSHVLQGGSVLPYQAANDAELAFAENILKQTAKRFNAMPLCARVDFLVDEAGQPYLIELELIEPELYLDTKAPEAYEAFATAIANAARTAKAKQ